MISVVLGDKHLLVDLATLPGQVKFEFTNVEDHIREAFIYTITMIMVHGESTSQQSLVTDLFNLLSKMNGATVQQLNGKAT